MTYLLGELEELGHKETEDKRKAEGGKGCLNNFIKDIDCSAKKVRFYSLSNGESLRHLEQESSFSNIHFGMKSIQHWTNVTQVKLVRVHADRVRIQGWKFQKADNSLIQRKIF